MNLGRNGRNNGDEDNEHELDAKLHGDGGMFAEGIYDGGVDEMLEDETLDDETFGGLEVGQGQDQYAVALGQDNHQQV